MADGRRSPLDPTVCPLRTVLALATADSWALLIRASQCLPRVCSGAGDGPAQRCVARVRPDLACWPFFWAVLYYFSLDL
jgi:hypothetical protein